MIDTQAIRSTILDLAIQGKLTEQLPEDGTAKDLYQQIQVEKQALIKTGKIKKEKPLPGITDDEIPFEIPQNWKYTKLQDISSIISKGTTPRGGKVAYAENGVGFLRAENLLGYDRIDTSCLKYVDEEAHRGFLKRSILETGDILVSIAGTLGKTGLVRIENLPLNTNQAIAFVRIVNAELIESKYIVYALNSTSIQKALLYKKIDMAIPNLSLNNISNIVVPIPPLAEQKRIVEKIEQAFSVLDTIDTLQAQYADNLTVLKGKLINLAIQGKLTEQLPEDGTAEDYLKTISSQKEEIEKSGALKGRKKKNVLSLDDTEFSFEIPETWQWIRLDAVAEVFGRIGFRGYTKNDIVVQGQGAISLSPSNITKDGKIVFEKNTYISWEKYEESPEIMVNDGDILIVKTGSSYGKSAVANSLPEKATINPQLAILKYVLCNKDYLHIVLNSSMARKQYEDFVIGAATPTFSQEDLANFLLPLPPLAEQKRIVERLDQILAVCDEMKVNK